MKLTQLSQEARRLKCIEYAQDPEVSNGFPSVRFFFEGGVSVSLGVDTDTDELTYAEGNGYKWCDLGLRLPVITEAYGMALLWSWEMKNHQNYFDAVQLEFFDDSLKNSVTLQFKVAASMINAYAVSRIS